MDYQKQADYQRRVRASEDRTRIVLWRDDWIIQRKFLWWWLCVRDGHDFRRYERFSSEEAAYDYASTFGWI
jgi:hypothetical protein